MCRLVARDWGVGLGRNAWRRRLCLGILLGIRGVWRRCLALDLRSGLLLRGLFRGLGVWRLHFSRRLVLRLGAPGRLASRRAEWPRSGGWLRMTTQNRRLRRLMRRRTRHL